MAHHGVVQLDAVPNVRDFGGLQTSSGRKIKSKTLFRAPALALASPEDFEWIKQNIHTIVDLRDTVERKRDAKNHTSHKVMSEHYRMNVFEHKWHFGERTSVSEGRQLFSVPLMPMQQTRQVVWDRTTVFQKASYVFWAFCCCNKKKATRVMMPGLWSLGLRGINELMLNHSKTQLLEVLKLIATPEHLPLAFHCTVGKDRTGLVSALVLHILGVPRAAIIHNYALTEKVVPDAFWVPHRANGLTNEMLASPPIVMEGTLEWLDQRYGSIDAYLDHLGFTEEWRQRMRDALLE